MKLDRRTLFLSALSTGPALTILPKNWSRPIIDAVLIPAHAQTSVCTGFDIEPIDRSIDIVVTDTEVRGPIIAILDAAGSFDDTQTISNGSCNNGSDFTQETTFSGTVNSVTNEVSGDLLIRQFCGDSLFCEQISVYAATQVIPDMNSDLGDYQGRITGTQTCCQDFL